MSGTTRPPADAFALHEHPQVDRSGGPDACWPWMGSRGTKGYAQWRGWRLSRLVLGQVIGRDLVSREQACHHCDNPPCLNPRHLFLGTNRDNVLDMLAKGREPRQMRPWTYCRRGHSLTPDNRSRARGCLICRRARSRAPEGRAARVAYQRAYQQRRREAIQTTT